MEHTIVDQEALTRAKASERAKAKRERERASPLRYDTGRRLLALFARYHFLTAEQAHRALLFTARSQSFTHRWLAHLTEAGYLVADNWLPNGPGAGKSPLVWSLTRRGHSALTAMGVPVRRRIAHAPRRSDLFLEHTFELNNALIALALLPRAHPDVALLDLRHERDLEVDPPRVALPDGKAITVEPDGWVLLEVAGRKLPFLVELDRGTERFEGTTGSTWKRKLTGLLALTSGTPSAYERYFGIKSARVAVVIRPDERRKDGQERLEELLGWIERYLAEQRRQSWGPFFRLTCAAPSLVDPVRFVGGSHWLSPFERRPTPLIEHLL